MVWPQAQHAAEAPSVLGAVLWSSGTGQSMCRAGNRAGKGPQQPEQLRELERGSAWRKGGSGGTCGSAQLPGRRGQGGLGCPSLQCPRSTV